MYKKVSDLILAPPGTHLQSAHGEFEIGIRIDFARIGIDNIRN